jgi:hypothetical protein
LEPSDYSVVIFFEIFLAKGVLKCKTCFFSKKFSTFATLTNWCFFSKKEKISNWSSVHKGGKTSSKANMTMRPKVPKHFPKGLVAYMVGVGVFPTSL